MVWEALAQAAADDLSRAVMLGDSLTSDVLGALNAGIDAVRAKGIEAELLKKWLGD